MYLGNRRVKLDSLSILLRDNPDHDLLYWPNVILSKMAGFSSDFEKWARKPETKAKLASEKKCAW